MNKFMEMAYNKALENSADGVGGPFGCCIVKDGEVISLESNSVLKDNDPTAHGEVNAIRAACRKLGTYDLSGCELYTTHTPCPMCLSAIVWANISKVYFGCTALDTEELGFRDEEMYKWLSGELSEDMVPLEQLDREECLKLCDVYKQQQGIIY